MPCPVCRYINALRERARQRSQRRPLPPICGCADNAWLSHPDTCASNCPFHRDPRGESRQISWGLRSVSQIQKLGEWQCFFNYFQLLESMALIRSVFHCTIWNARKRMEKRPSTYKIEFDSLEKKFELGNYSILV